MDIVDSQVHLNRIGTSWVTADPSTTIEAGLAAMDALGVDSLVIDERAAPVMGGDDPNARPLPGGGWGYASPLAERAVALHPGRFAYVTRIDRRDPEMARLMAAVPATAGCLATRIELTDDTGELDPYRAGAYAPYFAAAEEHAVPVFVWIAGRVELLVPALEAFPGLQFVLDHCGVGPSPPADPAARIVQLDRVIALARFPNVALKWCKASYRVSSEPYPHRDLDAHLRRVVDAFGPERVMWASDATQTRAHETWSQALHYLLDSGVLAAGEKEWMLGRTARTLLRWQLRG